jgi:hypothetical protein
MRVLRFDVLAAHDAARNQPRALPQLPEDQPVDPVPVAPQEQQPALVPRAAMPGLALQRLLLVLEGPPEFHPRPRHAPPQVVRLRQIRQLARHSRARLVEPARVLRHLPDLSHPPQVERRVQARLRLRPHLLHQGPLGSRQPLLPLA